MNNHALAAADTAERVTNFKGSFQLPRAKGASKTIIKLTWQESR
jgi:hypothetical protein